MSDWYYRPLWGRFLSLRSFLSGGFCYWNLAISPQQVRSENHLFSINVDNTRLVTNISLIRKIVKTWQKNVRTLVTVLLEMQGLGLASPIFVKSMHRSVTQRKTKSWNNSFILEWKLQHKMYIIFAHISDFYKFF